MKSKKFVLRTLLSIFSVISISLLINYIIDPLQMYHKAKFYNVEYNRAEERYLNAGFIRTYNFDSIIIGASLSENFLISDIKKYLHYENPIKMSIGGGSSYELYLTLEAALKKKQVKKVLYSINPFALFHGDKNHFRYGINSFPEYLYNSEKGIFNKYIMNFDTLKKSFNYINNIILNKKDLITTDYNTMYSWYYKHKDKFNSENALKSYKDFNAKFNSLINDDDYDIDKMKENFRMNLELIVQHHPNIEFTFFYPPRSILYYKTLENNKYLDRYLDIKQYVSDHLLQYKNVKLYDFQIDSSMTHSLDYYMDYSHFNLYVSEKILSNISLKKYLLNEKENAKFIQNLNKQTKKYILEYTKD